MSEVLGERHFADLFDRSAERRAADPAWLRGLREQAMGCFREQGFPTRRLDAWRQSSVSEIAKGRFDFAEPDLALPERPEVEAACCPVFACSVFVFVDGRFAPGLSTPRSRGVGPPVESLARLRDRDPEVLAPVLGQLVDCKQNAFAALNTAFFEDGASIRLEAGASEEEPIHLVFVSTGAAAASHTSQPRVVVHARAGSRATLIQDHVSLGEGLRFTNAVTEISLEAGAALDFVLLQREGPEALCVSNLSVQQRRDSRFAAHSVALGGRRVRNDLRVELTEPGAECDLRGLFFASDGQHVDNHTLVDHAVPRCRSAELYKGILAGDGRGVFRGRVVVRPDAQHTRADQSNPNLLLSDRARVHTQPQLEIRADDVRCSHGSSVGQLDAEALFYLRSRGIAEVDARDLLTRGFAAEIARGLPVPALGERVQELLVERLRGPQAAGQAS